jgi:iron(III) transport system permease protein
MAQAPSAIKSRSELRQRWAVLRPTGWRLLVWVLVAVLLVIPSLCFLLQAFSPRLFGQGSAWLTLANLSSAFHQGFARAMLDSLVVGVAAAVLAVVLAMGLAILVERTDAWGGGAIVLGLWAVLLAPSYLIAVGWEEIVLRGGILGALGLWSPSLQHMILGPVGVALVLGLKGVPFAYFALAPSLAAIGGDLEAAIRTHGGGRLATLRILAPLLLPALLSGFVIVFAESVGDFGVAATIAASAHFPIATYLLYESISTFPANFGVAAVIGWGLVVAVGVALLIQGRLLRGRSFAVVTGRGRSSPRRQLGWRGRVGAAGFTGAFFLIALGVPLVGVIFSSVLVPFEGLKLSAFTFANYRDLLGVQGLGGPIRFSGEMALVCGLAVVALGAVLARTMAAGRSGVSGRLLDLTLVVAVALPGVVFAAGYIFAYDLPFLTHLGIALYGTTLLLGMAYVANSVPSSSRLLLGPFTQVQDRLLHAARVHGASGARAWRQGVLPLLARPILWAFLLAFAGIFLELPISELLAPPNVVPVSVAVLSVLGKANIGEGTALSVVAILIVLAFVGALQVMFRFLAPVGWRKWQEQRVSVAEAEGEELASIAAPAFAPVAVPS